VELTEEEALLGWQDYIDSAKYDHWTEVVDAYKEFTTKNWNDTLDSIIKTNFIKSCGSYRLKADPFSLLSTIKAFYKEPSSTTYNHIRCPVLLFHATFPIKDSSRDAGIAQIKHSINDIQVIGLENTKHNVHWDRPEDVANEISQWIEEINE
jgi:pimeloyl-ACP methyl ester carboxylesterase